MKSGLEVNSFYGKKSTPSRSDKSWEGKLAKLENRAQAYKIRPVKSKKRQRISTPLPVFKRFPRQQMALDFAKACYQDVHVFAEEKDSDGKRSYVVATLEEFWSKYRELKILERHYYEVIPQGAVCRLYFDLEFKRHSNPTCSGSDMVDIFIKYVSHCLFKTYDIRCHRSCVLDLDSSTSVKFSRHLIFHLPDAAFQDNIHTGNFVHQVCSMLMEKLWGISAACSDKQLSEKYTAAPSVAPSKESGGVSLEDLQKLSILDEKGDLAIFVDEGVYTKNRNFRLYLSTKMGKSTPLTLGQENVFKRFPKLDAADPYPGDPDYQVFLNSLISNVSAHQDPSKLRVLTHEGIRKPDRVARRSAATETNAESSTLGYERSPHPQIDQFISRNISKGGVQGEIRRWVYFPHGKLITYDIVKNRWCENIGRAHKSNHIMMVVDLKLGVYYQKCHDPDCKKIDFRSQSLPIPEEINPFHLEEVVGECREDDEEDDAELCRAAAEGEESYRATLLPTSAEHYSDPSTSLSDRNVGESFSDTPHPDCDRGDDATLRRERTSAEPWSAASDVQSSSGAAYRDNRGSVLELSDSELLDCLVENLDDEW